MSNLLYKTIRNVNPQGKQRVFYICLKQDFEQCFNEFCEEIFELANCAIYYLNHDEKIDIADLIFDISQMQLVVIPVTNRLLSTPNIIRDEIIPAIIQSNQKDAHCTAPILPIVKENIDISLYSSVFGNIQYLDSFIKDDTAIPYAEKFKKYITTALLGERTAEQVENVFEKNIFLSYRKKDRYLAQDLIRTIHKDKALNDVAVWYDEFLVPSEDFNSSILENINKCNLFTMAITPNLVNEDNYVMSTEYPEAVKMEKTIFAAELIPTSKDEIRDYYINHPDVLDRTGSLDPAELVEKCINVNNADAFYNELRQLLDVELNAEPYSSQKSYLLGLAYLTGTHVEVDRDKGIKLISDAAEMNNFDACEKLAMLYWCGVCIDRDYSKATHWFKKSVSLLSKTVKTEPDNNDNKFKLLSLIVALTELLCDSITTNDNLAEAEKYLLSAYAICTNMSYKDIVESSKSIDYLIKIRRRLAIVYEMQNKFDDALIVYKELIESVKTLIDCDKDENSEELDFENNRLLARIHIDLATLYAKTGKYSDAANSDTAALYIFKDIKKSFPDASLDREIIRAQIKLAEARFEEGDGNDLVLDIISSTFDLLEPYLERDRSKFETDYAKNMLIKAFVLTKVLDDTDEAIEKAYLTVIEILQKHLDENISEYVFDYMVSTYRLANLYMRRMDLNSAEKYFKTSIKIAERFAGAIDNPTINQLANIYFDFSLYNVLSKDLNTALDYLDKSEAAYKQVGKYDPNVQTYLSDIRLVRQKIENISSGANSVQLGVAEKRNRISKLIGNKHDPYQLYCKYLREGEKYENRKNYTVAYKQYRKAEEYLLNIEHSHSPKIWLAENDIYDRLAVCCEQSDHIQEAYNYYLKAVDVIISELQINSDDEDELVKMFFFSLDKLASFCEDFEMFDRANAFYAQLVSLYEKQLQDYSDEDTLYIYAKYAYKTYYTSSDKSDTEMLRKAISAYKELTEIAPEDKDYAESLSLLKKMLNSNA